ncbi:tryptophan biosynthesis modulator TrpM [Kitasatospora sp. SUK 42]|uniref:tryptophan biosynthesis modulator TrpM n=1 Tax=Kitasatospora sp. SUK 42 TaxID=1588882 RepID=UPI0035AB79A7
MPRSPTWSRPGPTRPCGTRTDAVRMKIATRLAPGCRPRGCRAPARRVLGRRVRYVIGCEPGQVPGRRWRVTQG